MIRYLIDSSALWRILRDDGLRAAWADVVTAGAVGSCHPQRVEFRRSARTVDEYEQMSGMFDALYPDAAVPKNAWRWVDAAQHKLTLAGQHRSAGPLDLLVAATAVHHNLTILHDDKDYTALARVLPEIAEHRVTDDRLHLQPPDRPRS